MDEGLAQLEENLAEGGLEYGNEQIVEALQEALDVVATLGTAAEFNEHFDRLGDFLIPTEGEEEPDEGEREAEEEEEKEEDGPKRPVFFFYEEGVLVFVFYSDHSCWTREGLGFTYPPPLPLSRPDMPVYKWREGVGGATPEGVPPAKLRLE
jgi:hypothetical protein